MDWEKNAEFVRTFLGAANAKWLEAIVAFMHDDVRFCFASYPAVIGAQKVEKAIRKVLSRLQDVAFSVESICHGQWENGDMACIELTVVCTLANGLKVTIPCALVLRLAQKCITDCRVFMDPAPVEG